MTLEQRLFLHRQLARLLEPVPPDVSLKILADFEAEIKSRQPRQPAPQVSILPSNVKPIHVTNEIIEASKLPPGTTAVTPEARQLLREAAEPKP